MIRIGKSNQSSGLSLWEKQNRGDIMEGALDISFLSMGICFLLLIIPIIFSLVFKLKMIKQTVIGVLRMTVQLALIAVFLRYIFAWDNPFINVGWFFLMVLTATVTVINKSQLNLKMLLGPALISLLGVSFILLLYFNAFVVRLDSIFDAKYFIPIGGMFLGNSLKSTIIALNTFYTSLKRNEQRYLYSLSTGATKFEGIRQYYRKSLATSLAPILATMATTGIVSLPGMLTGQILGGSSPVVAVKYQIAVMIAIFVTITVSNSITILMTVQIGFNDQGIMRKNIFRPQK